MKIRVKTLVECLKHEYNHVRLFGEVPCTVGPGAARIEQDPRSTAITGQLVNKRQRLNTGLFYSVKRGKAGIYLMQYRKNNVNSSTDTESAGACHKR